MIFVNILSHVTLSLVCDSCRICQMVPFLVSELYFVCKISWFLPSFIHLAYEFVSMRYSLSPKCLMICSVSYLFYFGLRFLHSPSHLHLPKFSISRITYLLSSITTQVYYLTNVIIVIKLFIVTLLFQHSSAQR